MNQKLQEHEKKLYRQVDETLHYLWDPIGVKGIAQARDEYHSYLPHVFSLVLNQAKAPEIAAYLVEVEKNSMGLPPNKEKALGIAETLLSIREAIIEDGF
jgi:hypothetical protein